MSAPIFAIDSAVKGIDFPGLPSHPAGRLLSVLFQLEQTQWWPEEVMAEHQFGQIERLIAHAQKIPFYRERLREFGWSPGDTLTAKDWRAMPILSREEIQQEGPAMLCKVLPPGHGKPMSVVTSGSTGRPLRTGATDVSQVFWRALTLRDHLWHRRDFTQKLATIRQFVKPYIPPPEGAQTENWGLATAGLIRTGPTAVLHIDRTVAQQARWLQKQDPGYILTYPSNALALAEHFAHRGETLPSLLHVRTFGEVLEPSMRRGCQEAWGVPVIDMYSTQEVGYIGLQCPDTENYHVQSETLFVEILDDAGKPCAPGQLGRVVVTTLHNFATPLIRYDQGDFAEVGPACACGRGLPVLTRVVGRQRNVLVYPNGDRRWPTFGDSGEYSKSIGGAPRLLQFQVIQRTVDDLQMRMVTEGRPFNAFEEDAMRDYLARSLRHRFNVTFSYHDLIPRSEGGKFEDFRSEVVT